MSEATTAAPAAPSAPVAPAAAPAAPPSFGAPVAPAAPSPAPAAPAPEAAPAPTQKSKGKPSAVEYAATGDTHLDTALSYVGRLGIAQDHPAMQAAFHGDFSLLRAELAANPDAHGYEAFVALGEQAFKAHTEKETQRGEAIVSAVHDAVGGSEQYEAIRAWAKQNADPHERDAINRMLNADPVQARAAAVYLAHCYSNAQGTVVKPQSPVRDGATPASPASSGPLSPAAYSQAVGELAAKIGSYNIDTSPEYAALKQRRRAWRG